MLQGVNELADAVKVTMGPKVSSFQPPPPLFFNIFVVSWVCYSSDLICLFYGGLIYCNVFLEVVKHSFIQDLLVST
jgi:hypothetical protein